MAVGPDIRFGPAGSPDRESQEAAVELLVSRGYTACELDFEGGFWLGMDDARRLGELAAAADITLSVHAPLPAFLGHLDRGQKFQRALGMLDHTAHLARVCGARLAVIHPGFLLGRRRGVALRSVAQQLGELRERLEKKDRLLPFGVEIMGRVRDLGSLDDILWLSDRLGWVQPVVDFAHLHAVTDGAFVAADEFHRVLTAVEAVLPPEAPFHIHFSDVAFANRNETKHLPYGEGTLRADLLRDALQRSPRLATVISESPDERSHQAIKAILFA